MRELLEALAYEFRHICSAPQTRKHVLTCHKSSHRWRPLLKWLNGRQFKAINGDDHHPGTHCSLNQGGPPRADGFKGWRCEMLVKLWFLDHASMVGSLLRSTFRLIQQSVPRSCLGVFHLWLQVFTACGNPIPPVAKSTDSF
jgi:hypothetical protein